MTMSSRDEFLCEDGNCGCQVCGWWCSCGCNGPNGKCRDTSEAQIFRLLNEVNSG